MLYNGRARAFTLTFPDQRKLVFRFRYATDITVQDNRQWGTPQFTIRFGQGQGILPAGKSFSIDITIAGDGMTYSRALPDFMKPVTLKADEKWIPLQDEVDIMPGSALDLSPMGFLAGPCGSKGRVIATPDGHFAFANDSGTPRRFYGVNLCFGANYLTKEEADRLLDRLVRLGYNAVRIHHYEGQLTAKPAEGGLDWDPAQLDRLDYLIAGCSKRGIWVTTDLFVSRPIAFQQIGLQDDGLVPMQRYKLLVLVHEPAYRDWENFARQFLTHVNPYTGKRLADEPALAWISLINEGSTDFAWGEVLQTPEWQEKWNRWLALRYTTRPKLSAALEDLDPGEEAGRGTVALPPQINANTARGRLCQEFVAEVEKSSFERMRDFLRNEIKCPALLTNMNCSGSATLSFAGVRDSFDYVDEHFYVDHPRFLRKAWNLPSRCNNANPIETGADGASSIASVRLWGKPFTVTEFNYAGPGRYRGVGGILTGAQAALQNWDGIWRFDYGSREESIIQPTPMNYFSLAGDPLNQAADRLALLLFLRGDVSPANARMAVTVPHAAVDAAKSMQKLSDLTPYAWVDSIGDLFGNEPGKLPNGFISVPPPTQPPNIVTAPALPEPIRSDTNQITLTPDQGTLLIDTPRSAGGFAKPGQTLEATGAGVKIDGLNEAATVFVSSLDGQPIAGSKRLLVTHLTDLQNTGIRYAEGARRTLLEWGTLPHLVRDGTATIHVTLQSPELYTVWALSVGGRRMEKITTKIDGTQLVFPVTVKGPAGARLLYEIAIPEPADVPMPEPIPAPAPEPAPSLPAPAVTPPAPVAPEPVPTVPAPIPAPVPVSPSITPPAGD
jgi:hypothetical protein